MRGCDWVCGGGVGVRAGRRMCEGARRGALTCITSSRVSPSPSISEVLVKMRFPSAEAIRFAARSPSSDCWYPARLYRRRGDGGGGGGGGR
jgi:hypothetical protein